MSKGDVDILGFSIIKIMSPFFSDIDNFEDVFEKIKKAADEFSYDYISSHKVSNKKEFISHVYEILAEAALNQMLTGVDVDLDACVSKLNSTLNLQLDLDDLDVSNELIGSIVFKATVPAFIFNDKLFMGNSISTQERELINDIFFRSCIKVFIVVREHFSKLLINEKNSDTFRKRANIDCYKIAANIYKGCLESLFEALDSDSQLLKEYIGYPSKFVDKVESSFVDNFSRVCMGSEKIRKNL